MKNFILIFISFAIILTTGCGNNVNIVPEGVHGDILQWCVTPTYMVSKTHDGFVTTSCEVANPLYNPNKGEQCICNKVNCTCTK